jgi:hypothetical protein
MRTLTSTITAEQKKTSVTPRAKLEIKTFGYPVDPQEIRSDTFDWHLVRTCPTLERGLCACASDGSLILTNFIDLTVRFPDPQYDTDYSAWNPTSGGGINGKSIIGAPSTAGDPTEVMMFRISGGNLQYSQSTDYGASFGSWTTICASTFVYLSACYKPNGDICVALAYKAAALTTVGFVERVGGSWDAASTDKALTLTSLYTGAEWFAIAVSSIAYDGDFFVSFIAVIQPTAGVLPIYYRSVYGVWGDGTLVTANTWYPLDGATPIVYEISTALASDVNSIKDITVLDGTSYTKEDIQTKGRILSLMSKRDRSIVSEKARVNISQDSTGERYVYKIANYPILYSYCNGDEIYIMSMDRDFALTAGTFDKANTIQYPYPLALCANSEFIFATSGYDLFMSPLPVDWKFPAAGSWTGSGAGAGTLQIPDTRVVQVKEDILEPQQPNLSITLNNYDDYFANPASLGIERKGQCKLFYGLDISGTPEYSEAQTYYIKNWDYVVEDNAKFFVLNLYSALDLLNLFVFRKGFSLNPSYDPSQYHLYDIIGLIVSCIGGAISYDTRSAECLTIYPRMDVRSGETAGSLAKRLIYFTSDVVRFRGVNCVVSDALSSDSPVYTYSAAQHPAFRVKTSSELKTLNSAYIIGVAGDGRTVYGVSGSGENFITMANPMCYNETMTASMAANIITKSRLLKDIGEMISSPNLGTEIHDVVSINGTNYRITGYSRILDKINHKWEQKLNLTNV